MKEKKKETTKKKMICDRRYRERLHKREREITYPGKREKERKE